MLILAFLFILLFATAHEQKEQFILKPIGKVRKVEGSTKLILEKKYEPVLQGIDKNSQVWALWWFDRNDTAGKRLILQVYPCGNPENPLTGVFACRSPFRPNLIALSLCRILSVENNVVELEDRGLHRITELVFQGWLDPA